MTRLAPLDGLRAAAVLIVMLSHAGMGQIIPGGFGVTIFFFLSGYLITTLMVEEWKATNSLDFRGFYLRRTFRIIPPMVIAIGLAVSLSAIGLGRELTYHALAWDFLFLSNYAPLFDNASNIPIPLWSLAVEEHFYLIFPILFHVICKFGGRTDVALVCLLLCLFTLALRLAHVTLSGPSGEVYYWSHTRIDSILFGCILATWNNPATNDRPIIGANIGWAFASAAILLLTLALRDPEFRDTWRYTLQGIGLFLFFNYALRAKGRIPRLLSSGPLRLVADLSYFLYLIHFPLLLATSYLSIHFVVQYALAFALSFLLAVLVRRYVELPLLAWRKSLGSQPAVKVSNL